MMEECASDKSTPDGFQDFEELEVCKETHEIEWENFYRRTYVFRL
ncbi:hypothetical protein HanRHA438_Chr14g0644761 [Helianthus annuus]|nr:hypothetical protein HanRHA438_Chr14g0644761 [Helianthus annuus]